MTADRRTVLSLLGSGALATGLGTGAAARRIANAGPDTRDLDQPPANVMRAGTTASLSSTNPTDFSGLPDALVDAVYDRGVVAHPEDGRPLPWAVTDWTVGSGDQPVVEATVRDGLAFHDGRELTAGDLAFTAEFARDHSLGGAFNFVDPEFLEAAEAPNDATVRFQLERRAGSFLFELLRLPILPAHRWRGESNPQDRRPGASLVGSGAFRITGFEADSRVVLERRTDTAHPVPAALDLLPDDGPFIRRLDVRAFGQDSTLSSAISSDVVDIPLDGLEEGDASTATTADHRLSIAPSGDFDYVAMNTRRVPLDDPAIRQTLALTWDDRGAIDHVYGDQGAVDADLTLAEGWSWFRPRPPDGPDGDAYEMPRSGGGIDIDAARSFLATHDRAGRTYTWEAASHSAVGDRELYVDGTPVSEAHTDNVGTDGEGAFEVMVLDSSGSPRVEAVTAWVDRLNRLGIPATTTVTSFGSAFDRVFYREEFDCFVWTWFGLDPHNAFLSYLWGRDETDLDGTNDDAFRINVTGYTGLFDAADDAKAEMDPAARRGLIKDGLETVHEDVPMFPTAYPRELQPVADRWSGVVEATGGIANRFTWLGAATNRPPTLSVTASPSNPTVDQPVTLAADVTDPDGDDVAVAWDVGGDGSIEARGPTVEYAFESAGTHEVVAEATDDAGLTASASLTVSVEANEPPNATIDVEQTEPTVGEPVTFDASGSSDPDGEIVEYAWDLSGDGEFGAEGQQVTYTYDGAMEVLVRLRVTDDGGATATADTTIEVQATPTPSPEPTDGEDRDEDDEEEADGGVSALTPGFGIGTAVAGLAGALGARSLLSDDEE